MDEEIHTIRHHRLKSERVIHVHSFLHVGHGVANLLQLHSMLTPNGVEDVGLYEIRK